MTALDWNSPISNDGSDFRLLEPGVYPFVIKSLEKSYYNGSGKIPPCPKALVTLRVNGETDVTDGLLLDDSLEWKLCQFFNSIGVRKHGETYNPNWDGLVGKAGYVKITNREWVGNDGNTRQSNQVDRYLDPADVFTTPTPSPAQPAATAGASW